MDARALALALLLALPLGASALVGSQDDAGSGRDAPNAAGGTPLAAPLGRVLRGNLTGIPQDPADWYAVDLAVGDRLAAEVQGLYQCPQILDPAGAVRASACTYAAAVPAALQAEADRAGTWWLRLAAFKAEPYAFAVAVNAPPPSTSPLSDAGDLSTSACPQAPAAEAGRTAGSGDAAHPTLAWAALKTGFRAVVAWTTPTAVAASLEVDVGDRVEVLAETTPRLAHVFVLDGLTPGRLLCFRPAGGEWHQAKLANAMTAWDPDSATYSLNLLVLANEPVNRRDLVAGLDRYAQLVWDATDGRVRAGATIVLHGDFEHHHSGWASCHLVGAVVARDTPTCNRIVDVMFTADAFPAGAASTYRDGIQDAEDAIWMNSYWQAGAVNLRDDVGLVLAHEIGHYAFGAMDLYLGGSCYVPATGISIMGSSRSATEFDDERRRCPNEASIPGYVPTWTLLRQRYPHVTERASIDPGPPGNGGAYDLRLFGLHERPAP